MANEKISDLVDGGDIVSTDNIPLERSGTTYRGQLPQDIATTDSPSFAALSLSGDLTTYETVNDGNPEIRLGSSDAEELHIQSVYDSGAQTLDYVLFKTDVASVTADKGLFRFNVDGTDILDIDDGGLELVGNLLLQRSGSVAQNITTVLDGGGTKLNFNCLESNKKNVIFNNDHDGSGSPSGSQDFIFNIQSVEHLRIDQLGSVSVSNADFFVDTDTLFVDEGTDRVGVGTASPQKDLHVLGASGTGIQIDGASTYGFKMTSDSAGVDKFVFASVNRGTSTVNTNNILVLQRNGQVGINVATPGYALDVSGDANITGDYRIGGTSVLNSTTLGSGVVNSSLTNLGTLTTLTVDNITINANSITTSSGDLTIAPTSGQNVDMTVPNLEIYYAVNDGNPQVRIGSADAEELHIQAFYDSGAQTLDYVQFTTDTASATADKGEYRFVVDGTDIFHIDDGGIEVFGNIYVQRQGQPGQNLTSLFDGTGNNLIFNCNESNKKEVIFNNQNDGGGSPAGGQGYLFRINGTEYLNITDNILVTQPSTTAAVPVLELDQDDTDQAFINYVGNAAAGSSTSISTDTTSGATTHHIQIEINGTKAWVAASTNNPS